MKETTVSQKTGILPRLFARTNQSVLIVKEREIERDFPEVECVKLRQIGGMGREVFPQDLKAMFTPTGTLF